MNWVRQRVLWSVGRQGQRRLLHTYDAPSESLKTKIAEFGKMRRRRSSKKDKQSVFVEVPESMAYLDTATMPQILTAVGIALFAKLLMMYDDSRSQELIERKIKNAPAEQGTVRMLSREEWEEIREVRPRTPFESKLARPNARLRTGEPLRMEDVKDWTIDVLTDAFARVEESVRHTSKKYTSKNHHKAMVAKAGGKGCILLARSI
ncbi:uncharacterized protein LOC103958274 [Pyrus x bretschneideri]|uniref:uncharacterized protein LOC103958274 n=1 Tax=Pyrus x bretschneideri TaxID=225117 RepID=UPI00202E5CEF|nr:uncharacterized protein LOC103958274 [Pyrus x bretschneideri]XP_048445274.1 uncharacterized protein LOC103958274 [Pyrus x bretschneideri]